jgi:hypothetical protein
MRAQVSFSEGLRDALDVSVLKAGFDYVSFVEGRNL